LSLRQFRFRPLLFAGTLAALAGCGNGGGGTSVPQVHSAARAGQEHHPSLQPAIVVASFSGAEILEYALDASGDQAPLSVIGGKKTKINHVDNVALDKSDHIYATINGSEVAIYGAGAHGDARPIGHIGGSNTTIVFPIGVAVDSSGFVYVADCGTGKIDVFEPNAQGNIAPLRQLSLGTCVIELALDKNDHLYATSGDATITEYAPAGQGNSVLRSINEDEQSGGISIRSIAVDSHGYIYAGNLLAKDIRVYDRSASGNAHAVRTISGSKTHLGAPTGLALDAPDDNLYVTICEYCSNGSGKDSIVVFAPRANGNVKPKTVIMGTKTRLDAPTDLTIRQ
jgi:6-phosphogluconolactonase (cycloisomerase 2 family)